MLDDERTRPPNTAILSDDANSTNKIDSEALSLDVHELYLDQLYRQYNIEVNHALLFYIANEAEPVIFVDKVEISVGRGDARGRINPEFDLGNFRGAELGVSRLHARIVWDNKRYLIQDIGSTNHTWINGQKIVPYQWHPIDDGYTLQFGKLALTAFVITRTP